MKKKNTFFIVGAIVFVAFVLVLIFSFNNNNSSSENLVINNLSNGVVSNALDKENTSTNSDLILSNKLALHNVKEDCWIAYNGKVYDITDFLPKHPGSAEAIIPYCGTSSGFEEAFIQKHGTSKAGMLMKVGVLIGDFEKVGNLN